MISSYIFSEFCQFETFFYNNSAEQFFNAASWLKALLKLSFQNYTWKYIYNKILPKDLLRLSLKLFVLQFGC